jgi:hypothetical protein
MWAFVLAALGLTSYNAVAMCVMNGRNEKRPRSQDSEMVHYGHSDDFSIKELHQWKTNKAV